MRHRTSHRLQLIAAAALFSTGGAAIKSVTLTGWQVAGLRSGVAALTVLLLVPAARRGWNGRVFLVGVAYATTMILFVTANKLTTAANTIFLQSTAPFYILLLGPLLLKERIRREDLVFMSVVAAGLALFFVGADAPMATAPDPLRGNILAALAGFTWALTILGLRWLGSDDETSDNNGGQGALATVVIGNALAFLVSLPFSLPYTGATPVDWAIVSYLGIFQIGIAYLLLTNGIRKISALEASTLLLVEPALNPVWAWLVHNETPSVWAMVGGTAILSATIIKTWWDAAARPKVDAVV